VVAAVAVETHKSRISRPVGCRPKFLATRADRKSFSSNGLASEPLALFPLGVVRPHFLPLPEVVECVWHGRSHDSGIVPALKQMVHRHFPA
jgi:hypothetical protein